VPRKPILLWLPLAMHRKLLLAINSARKNKHIALVAWLRRGYRQGPEYQLPISNLTSTTFHMSYRATGSLTGTQARTAASALFARS
jgi:hypothetical protein